MATRTRRGRSIWLLAALVAGLLVALPSSAGAGRFNIFSRLTRPARPSGPATVAANGARYRPSKVSGALARRLGGRSVMAVGRGGRQGKAYARDLGDTVEILFQPHASSFGHVLVRIGQQVYDMPNAMGARSQSFDSMLRWIHSPMYGFVFDSTPERVAELDRAFKSFIASRPAFSTMGSGPDGYSCAAFVTSVLASKAPELQIGLEVGATTFASGLFRAGSHQAVTLYGSAADQAGSESFRFERLD